MNVIFHIDEQEKWPLVLANVQNFVNEMTSRSETFHILILVNGPAVCFLESEETIDKVNAVLDKARVDLLLCRNALKGHALLEHANLKTITHEVVPAGVVALAEKQQEGYAYIRP
ncbi:DsrE family protein [Vagococcus lutrae]|uniref:DsrE family protein n=1 Tax=Vagococcus lutrae TaxID=81947 RepID=UPI0028909222|nr:DsrE family protein [Vagococcus lutrae]MDT2807727.1 DsrE family protein [Vagococcus lutrae]